MYYNFLLSYVVYFHIVYQNGKLKHDTKYDCTFVFVCLKYENKH